MGNLIEVFNTITEIENQRQLLAEELKQAKNTRVDVSKFYNVLLSTEEVAKFHGISASRVREYSNKGLLPLHPNSSDAKRIFRASDVLALDFAELKKQKLAKKYFY